MRKLWTTAHSIALGFLFGVSMVTGAIWFAVAVKAQGQAINIPIQNPSFEQLTGPLATVDPCGLEERSVANIPGWKFVTVPGSGGAGGLLKPNGEVTPPPSNGCNVPIPPNGQIVAFAQDTTILQTVRVPEFLTGSGVYTLKFFVASYFYWYPGQYTASASLSSFYEQPLCEASAHPIGDFTQVTLICPANHHYAADMTIALHGKGWASLFAGPVSLTFTRQL